MSYFNQETKNSQSSNISETYSDSSSSTPLSNFLSNNTESSAKSLETLFEKIEINSPQNLSTVAEEDEQKSLNSSFASIGSRVILPMITSFGFKDIDWHKKTNKKQAKKTPQKDFESQNYMNELSEQLLRSETDLKIAVLQKEFVNKKNEEIKENYELAKKNLKEQSKAGQISED